MVKKSFSEKIFFFSFFKKHDFLKIFFDIFFFVIKKLSKKCWFISIIWTFLRKFLVKKLFSEKQRFFPKTFYDKTEYVKKKFQNIMVFEKNGKKNLFPKNRAPDKTIISRQNHNIREPRNFLDFFSWFFSKIKFSTSSCKKNVNESIT